jgi:uncharacterized protein (TIGR03437 family)
LIFSTGPVHCIITVKTLLAALAMAACLYAQPNYPTYTAVDLLNGASFQPGFAPNTIVTLFTAGGSLSWNTVALQDSDLVNGQLPTALGGVQVFVATYPAPLYYVSPTQVNLLIPSNLRPGVMNLWLTRDGASGPVVQITVNAAAPALFQTSSGAAVATHVDGSVITASSPASLGEVIILYVTGLGWVYPAGLGWDYSPSSGWTPQAGVACNEDGVQNGLLPVAAQWLCNMPQLSVSIAGTAIDPGSILYAGVTPGYAGLYQINIRLPAKFTANPEVRVSLGSSASQAGIILPSM